MIRCTAVQNMSCRIVLTYAPFSSRSTMICIFFLEYGRRRRIRRQAEMQKGLQIIRGSQIDMKSFFQFHRLFVGRLSPAECL